MNSNILVNKLVPVYETSEFSLNLDKEIKRINEKLNDELNEEDIEYKLKDTTYKKEKVLILLRQLNKLIAKLNENRSKVKDPYRTCLWTFGSINGKDNEDPKIIREFENFRIIKIASGSTTAAVITEDSKLWMWGIKNNYYIFGLRANNFFSTTPVVVDKFGGKKVIDVALGERHALVITEDGNLWSWGDHDLIGRKVRDGLVPGIIPTFKDKEIIQIVCNIHCSAVITHDGELWTWGSNLYGKLGREGEPEIPAQVMEFGRSNPAIRVSCGIDHMGLVTESGNLYVWGNNSKGQLGMETLQVRENTKPILNQFFGEMNVSDVTCGNQFTYVKLTNNDVYNFGRNDKGQLVRVPGTSNSFELDNPMHIKDRNPVIILKNIDEITVGNDHFICFGGVQRVIYTGGNNSEFQLGRSSSVNMDFDINFKAVPFPEKYAPIQISASNNYSMVLMKY